MNLAVPELIWIVLSALLVLMMQAGFGCLESGLVRAKNSNNVVMKNLVDLCIATLAFWALGFGLMFGASQDGVFGTSHFFFDAQSGTFLTVGFFFQLMFCGTAVTIVSGAIAERVGFTGYAICTLLIALLVYPIFGHWVWGGGLGVPGTDGGEGTGWLATLGFVDFAGSTVVHSVGGWVSLALVLILGPRIGRFDNTQHFIEPHNLPLSMLGLLILWVGWFGFNGGSVLAWTDDVPIILINTLIAPAAAGLVAMIW
ncbi:MAG: diguanylate cyclase, partial [Pseudomonadota bacterium]